MKETRDSIADVWGPRTPTVDGAWPERVDERVLEQPDRWVQSACVLCSNGCGLDIGVKEGRIVGVRGRAVDRVNHGRLGPKGLHGWEANNSQDRLTRPPPGLPNEQVPTRAENEKRTHLAWFLGRVQSSERHADRLAIEHSVSAPGARLPAGGR